MTTTDTAAYRPGSGRPTTAPTRAVLRWLAALTLLATGATHIPVTPEHLEEAPYIGWLFLALTVVSFSLALLVLETDHPLIWTASGVVCALAVGAYLLSRSVALPQIGDDVGNWLEPLGVAAIAVEAATVVLAVLRLRHRAR
jgi:hypothetical protein